MATKRKRGNAWAYVIRRKNLLPSPWYGTFDTEEEGDAFCKGVEKLLDQGIIPDVLLHKENDQQDLAGSIDRFLKSKSVTSDDVAKLNAISAEHGEKPLSEINYYWVGGWVSSLKRINKLAPGTVRKYVGALARCLDEALRQDDIANNPLRMLERNYSAYSDEDARIAGEKKTSEPVDRRFEPGEEDRVRLVLAGGYVPEGKQRALDLKELDAMRCLFDLALESAMRLSEMYTLELEQIDLDERTVFLTKTKNGYSRQVPMTTIAVTVLREYIELAKPQKLLFPWYEIKNDPDLQKVERKRVTSKLSRQWGRVFDHAECGDFTFHCLRHEATSRLYERTTMRESEIMEITGHTSEQAHKIYRNLRGSHLAGQLW